MTDKIGWFFPPTGGGQEDGYNDSGMAHFRGARIGSLARETIQNSLDAHDQGAKAVHMSFEVLSLDAPDDSFGRAELRRAIESRRVRAQADEDHGAVGGLTRALGLLDSGEVAYLRISDRNTTGLTDRHWKALVKVKGLSVKRPGSDPLGSHGIGKYAPFAVSPLRTVFYWTAFPDNGRVVEKLQGKSVLMTHEGPERLPDEKKEVGRKALKRVADWIRSSIREHAKPPETAATSALREVAELLPDPYAEDALGGGEAGEGTEKGFEDRIEELALKPIRRRPSRGLSSEATEADANAEGDGEQEGEQGGGGEGSNHGGDGDGLGRGEGEGRGGTGSRGGGATARLVPVHGVRVLPLEDRHELEVSFTSTESGLVQLQVDEAGDASTIPHADLIAFDEHGDRIDLQRVEIRARRRFRVRIRSTEPIHDRAWRVALRPAGGGEYSEA